MLNELIENITDYADYLKNSLHLQISFCNISNYFEAYMHILHPYNFHCNPYCVCIKTHSQTRSVCIEKQRKVLEKSADGTYYGACWAGVEEYVFPILCGESSLGFISVSGYRGHVPGSFDKVERVSRSYGIDYELLRGKYLSGLTEAVPPLAQLKTVIAPLCKMFELLYLETPPRAEEDAKSTSVYADILNYLCSNYTQNLTLADIAEHLHYSQSYIRQLFRRKSSHGIMHYITQLRIKRAKELLSNTSMRVFEIAFQVGYNDPNYFTNLFRKQTGMSPKEYRKSHTTFPEALTLEKFSRNQEDLIGGP